MEDNMVKGGCPAQPEDVMLVIDGKLTKAIDYKGYDLGELARLRDRLLYELDMIEMAIRLKKGGCASCARLNERLNLPDPSMRMHPTEARCNPKE